MITKDLKSLLRKLNDHTTRALEASAGFCISRGHYEVTIEHLLLKLLEDGSGDVPRILQHFDVEPGELWDQLLLHLEDFKSGNTGRPAFSPMMLQVVEAAWVVASVHHEQTEVRSGNLLEALLDSDALRAASYMDVLESIERDELRQHFIDIVGGSAEDRPSHGARRPSRVDGQRREGETALDLYTINLTERARNGEIDPIFGRDKEIRQMIDILSRRRKNNPILVGEAGVGKTAVVEGLALRISQGDVPDSLVAWSYPPDSFGLTEQAPDEEEQYQLFRRAIELLDGRPITIRTLDLGLLQAGASMRGEFEERLKKVIKAVTDSPRPVILFIDEAHTLIGAGGQAGQGDAANLLKPALARGELRTIAATTWSEYKKYIEKDPALERRFQLVKVEEPDAETAAIMLRGIKSKYEEHHGVPITEDAVRAAAELSDRLVERLGVDRLIIDERFDREPTAAEREDILGQVAGADVVLMPLYLRLVAGRGEAGLFPQQRRLAQALVEQDVPVVLVPFGNPYAVTTLQNADVHLVAYDQTLASVDAAVRILEGDLSPSGRLPIRVEPYDYGAGLGALE